MQQFHKFITWRLCVAQHVGRGLAGQTTTNNAATTNAPTVKPEAVNAVVNSWCWAWRPNGLYDLNICVFVGTFFIAVYLEARDFADSNILYYFMGLFEHIKIVTFITR